jgi:hypothetical protein
MNGDVKLPWWRSPTMLPFVVFLAIAGYFLWTEHQAHVIQFLPWILVLGCVSMHFFMHGGHGHGGDGGRSDREKGDRPWGDGGRKR